MAEAAAVFRGVLLVILLGPIEGSGKFDLCNDRALVHSRFLEPGDRVACGGFLFSGGEEDSRAVVVTDIKRPGG